MQVVYLTDSMLRTFLTFRYCGYVRSPGWTEHVELIDHRYFYHDDNKIGGYTCGLVRDAVANQVLELDLDTNFRASLGDFVNNRVLASIRSNGLKVFRSSDKGMRLRFFTKPSDIQLDIHNKPVLYRSGSPWPKHQERYIPLEDISMEIWTKYQEAEEAREEEEDKKAGEDQRSGRVTRSMARRS